jgi:hypothetical protein
MALPEEDLWYQPRQDAQDAFYRLPLDEQGKVLAAILSGQDGPQILFECEISHDLCFSMHPLGQVSLGYKRTVKGKPFLLISPAFNMYAREDSEQY